MVWCGGPKECREPGSEKIIAQIAKEMGKEPADAAWDLVVQGSGRVLAVYHMMSEPDIETALRFPWTSIGSDAGAVAQVGVPDPSGFPHPRGFGNAVRVIARYVKERNILTLEEAVRKMTSWPATRMRLSDRGVIRVVMADVTVFDLDALRDHATYDKPTELATGVATTGKRCRGDRSRRAHRAKPGMYCWPGAIVATYHAEHARCRVGFEGRSTADRRIVYNQERESLLQFVANCTSTPSWRSQRAYVPGTGYALLQGIALPTQRAPARACTRIRGSDPGAPVVAYEATSTPSH